MNRRQFLGAAAALHGLPTSTLGETSGEPDVNGRKQSQDDNRLWIAFEANDVDEDAIYGVESYTGDAEYPVGLHISANFGMVSSDMTVEKAEQLGRQLIDAAREGR